MISQYKKKVEDAQELRKQLKATEDRNLMYMQQNMDLEEVGVASWLWGTPGHMWVWQLVTWSETCLIRSFGGKAV